MLTVETTVSTVLGIIYATFCTHIINESRHSKCKANLCWGWLLLILGAGQFKKMAWQYYIDSYIDSIDIHVPMKNPERDFLGTYIINF